MSGLSKISFLKISGLVEQHKKGEFESTVKFACDPIPQGCIERSLSAEVLFGDEYFFFTSWTTEWALKNFIQSEEYHLVRSAYDALGILKKIEIGYDVEVKTILIPEL